MRGEGVIYVAGHPLLKETYETVSAPENIVSGGALLCSLTHSRHTAIYADIDHGLDPAASGITSP